MYQKSLLDTYRRFQEGLLVHNSLADGIGMPYDRKCSTPQGDPLSMMMVAMIMRPWLKMMERDRTQAMILADDIMLMASGGGMVRKFATALDKTHRYLEDMGAKVAPDKSFNFASNKEARKWLAETKWPTINAVIKVVEDFRYVGAHINTSNSKKTQTIDDRFMAGVKDLHRLGRVQVKYETKAEVINSKVIPATLYGAEVAECRDANVSKFTAAIIDAFNRKDERHDVDWFFTVAPGGKGYGPTGAHSDPESLSG